MAEYWDVYDENRRAAGRLHKRGVRMKRGDYHIVCEAWIVSHGKLLLTKRSQNKSFAGLWECTGGAVLAGEKPIDAIIREIGEEISLAVTEKELKFLGTKRTACNFIDCYQLYKDFSLSDLKFQEEEISDARLVSYKELCRMNREKLLIPGMFGFMHLANFPFVKGNYS